MTRSAPARAFLLALLSLGTILLAPPQLNAQTSAAEVRKELSATYARYDALVKRNDASTLLAYYEETLSPDYVFVKSQKATERAAFLADLRRRVQEKRQAFTCITMLDQKTSIVDLQLTSDSATATVTFIEEMSTIEMDLDTPIAGPDGLSGLPQREEVRYRSRERGTWVKTDHGWRLKRTELIRGAIDTYYLPTDQPSIQKQEKS